MYFLYFFLLFAQLWIFILIIECLWVVLIDIKIILLSKEAVGGHFKQINGLLFMFFHIPIHIVKQIRTTLDKSSNFIGYLCYNMKSIFLQSYRFKFHFFYFFNYKLINLQKLIQNTVVLEFEHYLYELP